MADRSSFLTMTPRFICLVLGLGLLLPAAATPAVMDATTECLVGFIGVPDDATNGGTVQQDAVNGSCTFNLNVCANRADATCAGTTLKPVKVMGQCQGASSLKFTPSGVSAQCGPASAIVVKTKHKNKKAGKCKIVALGRSTTKPRRVDKDVLNLVCNPSTNTTKNPCATATTCTPPSGTTVTCEPLVNDGQGIPGTYQMTAVPGPKLCQTNSTKNRFGPCTTDADCGPGSGLCTVTTFATSDGVVLPLGNGIRTRFTITQADPAPTCNHSACLACGNGDAACAGIPGCGSPPGQPGPGCIRNQCCDQPGFVIPVFLVPLLGGLCGRLDQYRCGFGVVNSSNPQTGDNEVTKTGDTSDPGADCCYDNDPNAADCIGGVNLHDDPPAKPCNTGGVGAGNDLKGKVQRCVGNGVCDTPGIHYRLAVPSLATTWQDLQSPQGTCAPGSIFDPGELIITQLVLNAEFTTAGATSSFEDLNGDGCAVAGAGFTNFSRLGPFTLGQPPAAPQPYDSSTCPAGGVCSVAVSAGIALTGAGPLFDTGFIAILTNGAMVRMPTEVCPCTEVQGCPE